MKYDTFKLFVDLVVDMYKTSYERDRAIAKALGGDTVVVMEDIGKFMDRITDIMADELSGQYSREFVGDWLDYLVYENMIMDDYDPTAERIEVDGKKYPVTPEVVWEIITQGKEKATQGLR